MKRKIVVSKQSKKNPFLSSPVSDVCCLKSAFSDYMHFRYYGSTIGRFMKPDNVTGSPLNPQNWNLYSYVRGNPVNMNDPTGHDGEETKAKVMEPKSPEDESAIKKQIQEEQTGNKDEEANKPPEGLPQEVLASAVQVRDFTAENNVRNPATDTIEPQEAAQITAYGESGSIYQSKQCKGEGTQETDRAGQVTLSTLVAQVVYKAKGSGDNLKTIYEVHSHGYNVPPTKPQDYDALKAIRNIVQNADIGTPEVIGIVATPKKIYVHDETKVTAIINYPK